MSGHVLSIAIALALLCGPLVYGLVGAYREKKLDENARKPRSSRERYTLGGAR